jgi:hypothetical protein
VYLYASCDRRYTHPQVARGRGLFRDRFTGQIHVPSRARMRAFMELTFANELDIAAHSPAFAESWPALARLFDRCQALVSPAAWDAYQRARPPGSVVGLEKTTHGR